MERHQVEMKHYAKEMAASANRAVTIEYEIGHNKDSKLHIDNNIYKHEDKDRKNESMGGCDTWAIIINEIKVPKLASQPEARKWQADIWNKNNNLIKHGS